MGYSSEFDRRIGMYT